MSEWLSKTFAGIFGDGNEEAEPDKVWLEERTNINKRAIRNNPNWRDNKTLYEQLEIIIDQNVLPWRIWDCFATCGYGDTIGEKILNSFHCPLATILPCVYIGLTEQVLGFSETFWIPMLKCVACIPFCSCCWIAPHLRTVTREMHEVPGDRYVDIVITCCCGWIPPCTGPYSLALYLNAKEVEEDWKPEEWSEEPESIQRQFIEDFYQEEDLRLD
jgi:hypothetical protein